jgi:hypothetical protein
VVTAAVGLTALGVHNAVAALAVGYVAAFWFVAWTWPHVALALIFAATPFQNDLSGDAGFARFSVAELNLVLVLPLFAAHMLLRRRLPALGPVAIPVALYLGVCAYSSAMTWRPESAPLSLVQMALFMFVSVMIFSSFAEHPERLRVCLQALVLSNVVLACVVLASGSGYVLGIHKNGTGPSLAMGLVVAVELWLAGRGSRTRWLAVAAMCVIAPAVVVTLSRGAWLAAACGVTVLALMRRRFAMVLGLAVVLAPLVTVAWMGLPRESREYATDLGPSRQNIQARYDSIETARRFYERNPLYGAGVGLRKEHDATNIVWFTLAETGVLGLVAFALVNMAFLGMVWVTQRRLDRDDLLFSMLAAGAALVFGTLARGLVDHYWQRGPAFAAWAAAGMATAVYCHVRALEAAPPDEGSP